MSGPLRTLLASIWPYPPIAAQHRSHTQFLVTLAASCRIVAIYPEQQAKHMSAADLERSLQALRINLTVNIVRQLYGACEIVLHNRSTTDSQASQGAWLRVEISVPEVDNGQPEYQSCAIQRKISSFPS